MQYKLKKLKKVNVAVERLNILGIGSEWMSKEEKGTPMLTLDGFVPLCDSRPGFKEYLAAAIGTLHTYCVYV